MEKSIIVKVVPGSKVEQIQKSIDGSIKVWVKGQPKEGEANRALVKLLSKYFCVPQSCIQVAKGLTSRKKVIKIIDKS